MPYYIVWPIVNHKKLAIEICDSVEGQNGLHNLMLTFILLIQLFKKNNQL